MTIQLEHTSVYRGGATASSLFHETNVCTSNANITEQTLDIKFSISSAGGGVTEILLQIGIEDLSQILTDVAFSLPETASLFLNCAITANNKSWEMLNKAKDKQATTASSSNEAVRKLELVYNFVIEQYLQAPEENDERELVAKEHITEALELIRAGI